MRVYNFPLYSYSIESCFEENIDYVGNDLNNQTSDTNYSLGYENLESAKDCRELCQDTNGCLGFTWESYNKTCSLKSAMEGKRSQEGAISGKKYCEETDPQKGISSRIKSHSIVFSILDL